MKKLVPITTALMLLFSSSMVSHTVQAEPSADEVQAIASVQSYMGALMAGDITQVRAFLAPKLLAERKRLLDNPTYAQRLQNAYANASFEVTDSVWLSSDKVRVDVKIQLNPQDVVHSRFVLVRIEDSYRIITER